MKMLLILFALFCNNASATHIFSEEGLPTYKGADFLAKTLCINDLCIAQDLQSKRIPTAPDQRKAKIEEYYKNFLIDSGRISPYSFKDRLMTIETLSFTPITKQVFLLTSCCYAGIAGASFYFFEVPLPLSIITSSLLEITSTAILSYESLLRFIKKRAHKNEIENEIQTLYQKDLTYYKNIKPKFEYGYWMFAPFKQEKFFTAHFSPPLKTFPLKKAPTDIIILIN